MKKLNPLLLIGLLTMLLGAIAPVLPLTHTPPCLAVRVWEDTSETHYLAARVRIYEGEQPSWNSQTSQMEWQNLLWDTEEWTVHLSWYGAKSGVLYTVRATRGNLDVSKTTVGKGWVEMHLKQAPTPEEPEPLQEPPEEKSPEATDLPTPPLNEPLPEPEILSPTEIPEPESKVPLVKPFFSLTLILVGTIMVLMGLMGKKSKIFLWILFLIFLLSPLLSLPGARAQSPPQEQPETLKTFGNPNLPAWKNITAFETANYVYVDNADGLLFKFRVGTAGYNEILENDTQIIADERWILEYLQGQNWKQRGIPQNVTWEQPEPYKVVVKRFYTDFLGTSFNVTYTFHGGYRPKISFEGILSQSDEYRIQWKISGINKTHVQDLPEQHYVKFWDNGTESIVFDYSDVYAAFGNITVTEVEPWAGNHKLNQIFNIGYLDPGPFYLDPNFGYETAGGTEGSIAHLIRGSVFTITEDGTATSITAYIKFTTGFASDAYFKCAIYLHSDLSLVGTTDENYYSAAFGPSWETFTFSTEPDLTADIEYILVAWGNRGGSQGSSGLYYDAGNVDQGHEDSATYGTWPNPLVPTHNDNKYSIYCTYTTNTAPTNDQCSITDMDDTGNLYAQRTWYTVDYDVTDQDGYADIDYAEVRFKQGTLLRATFRFDEDTSTFSIQTNSTQWDLDVASCSNVSSGTYINMTFKVKPQWDAIEEADLEIECYVVDAAAASDTDVMQTNYFDVVTDLVTTFTLDDDRGSISQTITASGSITYSGSSLYPPDAEFTSVSVYDSLNNNEGSDASIVNGAWSVTFSAPSTVGIDTYNLFINMTDADYTDGEETSPTDTFITDRFEFVSVSDDTGDQRIDVSSTFELRYQIRYDYDDVTFDSSKGSILGFTWDATNSWWDKTVTGSASVTTTNYDETYVSITDSTYGITVKQDVAGINIITDRIQVSFSSDATYVLKGTQVNFTVTLTREYDSSSVTDYSFNINRNGTGYQNPHTTGSFTDTQTGPVVYVYDFTAVTDNTYGLTAFVDPSDITVTWYNNLPTIGEFSISASTIYANEWFTVNHTINDEDGISEIKNCTVALNGTVILAWDNATGSFTINSDPSGYLTLNISACIEEEKNSTAFTLSWSILLSWSYPQGSIDILSANTKAYDTEDQYSSGSHSDLFTFEPDIRIMSGSPSKSTVEPGETLTCTGSIYYQGKDQAPSNTTGLTAKLETNSSLAGSTSSFSSGQFTISFQAPQTEGYYNYTVYSTSNPTSVQNQTFQIYVSRTRGPGGFISGEKTPLEELGIPPLLPPTVAPIEAQYGSIALIVIMGGAMIYYLRKPRTTRELFITKDKKASKKRKKASSRIQRNFKKRRAKW